VVSIGRLKARVLEDLLAAAPAQGEDGQLVVAPLALGVGGGVGDVGLNLLPRFAPAAELEQRIGQVDASGELRLAGQDPAVGALGLLEIVGRF